MFKQKTRGWAPERLMMMSQSEIVKVEWRWQQNCHHIAHGHPKQHSVGGCPHFWPCEHHHDYRVEDAGDAHEGGHDVTIDWQHQIQRPKPTGSIHLVALMSLEASG